MAFDDVKITNVEKVVASVANRALQALIDGRNAQNIIKNGSFESWSLGTSGQPPDGFTEIGSPTSVARATSGRPDGYGGASYVQIISGGSGNEGITVTLSGLKASTKYAVRVLSFVGAGDTAKIWTTGASSNFDESTTSTAWVSLIGNFTTDATPTDVVLNLGSLTSTHTVYFDHLMVVEGEIESLYSQHPNDDHLKAINYQDDTDPTPVDFLFKNLRIECGKTSAIASTLTKTINFGSAFTLTLAAQFSQADLTHGLDQTGEDPHINSISTTQLVIHNPTDQQIDAAYWIAIGVGG